MIALSKKTLPFVVALFVALACPVVVEAKNSGKALENYTPIESIPFLEQQEGGVDFPAYIQAIYRFVLFGIAGAAFFMISVGGFTYLTSAGNASRAQSAKSIMQDALLGLVVALLTVLLLSTINNNLTNFSIQPLNPPTNPGAPGGGGAPTPGPTDPNPTNPDPEQPDPPEETDADYEVDCPTTGGIQKHCTCKSKQRGTVKKCWGIPGDKKPICSGDDTDCGKEKPMTEDELEDFCNSVGMNNPACNEGTAGDPRDPLAANIAATGPVVKDARDPLSEQEARDLLRKNGVKINRPNACVGSQTTGCTNVAGLPTETIEKLGKLQKDCNCEIVLTGGTEPGHKTHGAGKGIVDLRLNPKLEEYIKNNSSNPTDHKLGAEYAVKDGPLNGSEFLHETNCNYPHWHVKL